MMIVLEHEEEENALKSLKKEQYDLMQEKISLIENFDAIKKKILDRM